ncbi:HAD family hydrolase [Streptomyces anulatus]|uniref:HAD family hydrolase n=1 Tax=Streptomyces anulatus TaxID=1892 RepID=UPI003869015D
MLTGETPADVAAGRAAGVPVLAVSTGRTSAAELADAGATTTVRDLQDPSPLFHAMLLGLPPEVVRSRQNAAGSRPTPPHRRHPRAQRRPRESILRAVPWRAPSRSRWTPRLLRTRFCHRMACTSGPLVPSRPRHHRGRSR